MNNVGHGCGAFYQRVSQPPSEIAYKTLCLDGLHTLAAGTRKLYLPARKCEEENKHSVLSLSFIRIKGALSKFSVLP